MKKIKKLLNILSLFLFILFLSNINILISKEYQWQLVDSMKLDLYSYRFNATCIIDSANYLCGGIAESKYPYIVHTSNSGKSWDIVLADKEINKAFKNQVPIKHIFKNKQNEIIAFADSGYYYKSKNLKDWERKRLIFKDVFILQDAAQYENVIIVSYYDIVFKSLDFGDTWEELVIPNNNIPNFKAIYALSIINKDLFYACYFFDKDGLDKNFFMKTIDGGKTWEEVSNLPVYFDNIIFLNEKIAFAHRLIGRNPSLFKTTDSGKTWVTIFHKDFGYRNPIFSLLPITENKIFMSTFGDDSLYYTEDSFATFTTDKEYQKLSYVSSKCLTLINDKKLLNPTIYERIYIYSDEDLLTGINLPEILTNTLVYPNPSADKISVDLGESVLGGTSDLSIYDILGNKIMSIPNYANKTEIDITNLAIGTYTIQIQTSSGSVSQRLLVNR